MKFFNILTILIICGQILTAQTLFETNETPAAKSPTIATVATKNLATPSLSNPSSPHKRLVFTNLESLIARGDIQLGYEIPQESEWAGILLLHVNPQSKFNHQTGDIGILGGGRLYFEEDTHPLNLYLQGLAGFNHTNRWDLMISVEIGHRMPWKKNVFLDIALAIHRSYASDAMDPMAYIKANLSFGLSNKIIPFI